MLDSSMSRRDFVRGIGALVSAAAFSGPAAALASSFTKGKRGLAIMALLPEDAKTQVDFLAVAVAGASRSLEASALVIPSSDATSLGSAAVQAIREHSEVRVIESPLELLRPPAKLLRRGAYRLSLSANALHHSETPDFSLILGRRGIVDPRGGGDHETEEMRLLVQHWRARGRVARTALCLRFEPLVPMSLLDCASSQPEVVIETNGQEMHRQLLDGQVRELEVPGRVGKAIVRVGADVRILHAPCRNKICQTMGPAATPGDSLLCAPNGLLVRISGRGGVDSVTG